METYHTTLLKAHHSKGFSRLSRTTKSAGSTTKSAGRDKFFKTFSNHSHSSCSKPDFLETWQS
jgi:hypothetical protein